MKRTILALVLIATAPLVAAEQAPEFSKDIAPLLRQYCAGCHNDLDLKGDLSLERYSDLTDDAALEKTLLVPGDLAGSHLLSLVTGKAKEPMPPKDEPQLTPAEVGTLKAWIAAGAKGPGEGREDESILASLEVPAIPRAKPKRVFTAMALSPNETRVALASYKQVSVHPLHEIGDVLVLQGSPGKVNAVHFATHDPTVVVAASGIAGLKGVATLWDLKTGEPTRQFGEGLHRDILYDAELSPDGTILATAGYDRKIALWEAATGKLLRTIEVHNGAIFDLAFSPDGKVLASASADETVKLWRVRDGLRLDTLGDLQGEQYAVRFTPDGKFIVAAGADNRIRLWEFRSKEEPAINPVRIARFGHEQAVVQLALSHDGRYLISSGDDRAVKLWSLPSLKQLNSWEDQPEVAVAVALAQSGTLYWARLDGTFEGKKRSLRQLPTLLGGTGEEVPPKARPADQKVHEVTVLEGSDPPMVRPPAKVNGVIEHPNDSDEVIFEAREGEEWICEVKAARMKSPLDSVVEVLTEDGKPIQRVLLQAMRDSWFEFRGKDSKQSGDFRIFNWREMELNEYLYCNGEVVKLWLYPRGPDSGFNVYPGSGMRHTWFGTSARTHALGEPCYIVKPLAPGEKPLANGLPVFPIYYENDDDPKRRLGNDSKLSFVAPEDGIYRVRLRDVRGFGGKDFKYELTMRVPDPDFTVSQNYGSPKIFRGSGRDFVVKTERFDDYEGEIRVEVKDLPPGFSVTSPILIEAGQETAMGLLSVAADAPMPTAEQAKAATVTAVAKINGQEVRKELGALGELKLTDEKPKLSVEIVPDPDSGDPKVNEQGVLELIIRPGETIHAMIKAKRAGFGGRIDFGNTDSVRNLTHGLIVDNIGLNGLMIPAGQDEQHFFITAAPWVPNSSRLFHLKTGAAGGQTTRAVLLHVRRK